MSVRPGVNSHSFPKATRAMVAPPPGELSGDLSDNSESIELVSAPFVDVAPLWRGAGWLGTIPLPPGQKFPPPTGWTGRNALFPDDEQIQAWCNDPYYANGNTGLHLGWPVTVNSVEYEVVGIDVDDYEDNGKQKCGGDQLAELVTQLGPLPPTWVSTARASQGDWKSGIRLFLVPRGLAFRGSAAADIEIIQKNHRFAVVWPSWNPKSDSQYCLYSPESWSSHGAPSYEIPPVTTISVLPAKWVDYLTQGRMRDSQRPIDTESSLDELADWAEQQFRDPVELCRYVRRRLDARKAEIAMEATSHDKVLYAHMEFVHLAAEGHTGWLTAINEATEFWIQDVISRDKREANELRGEIFRSLTGAFRKKKAEPGAKHYGKTPCKCSQSTGSAGTSSSKGKLKMTAAQSKSGTQLVGRSVDQVHSGHVRMAHRLAKSHGNRLLYVHGIGWHYWERTRWRADDSEARVKRAAMKVIAESIAEVIGNPSDEAKRLRSDARKCESSSGLDGMIRVARALKPFAATVDDIDADPYLLNVANGTVDLHTGMLRPHDPADRITKICNGAYLPDTASVGANWSTFLERVQPDDAMRSFTQRLIGVGLIGRIHEHILPILVGKGANGKSVFCEAIQFALGDYAITAEPDLLMHRDNAHPTGEMDLRGCRWVIVSESDKDRRLAETTVKRLTADAKVRARRMRQDFVEFRASHTLMLVTNHKPTVSGDDLAIWRRLRVVPFDVQIPKIEQDNSLGEKLQLEADAVVTWAIAGLMAYSQRGLDEPSEVLRATDAYHQESDDVGRFIAECCVVGPAQRVEPQRLHDDWCKWQIESGCRAIGIRTFGKIMTERGFLTNPSSNGKRWRTGIGLISSQGEPTGGSTANKAKK